MSMTRCQRLLPALFLVPPMALAMSIPPESGREKEEVELDEAEVFIELNSTDGDFGIQYFWDGDAWDRMTVLDAGGKPALKVRASSGLRDQGLAEGFFESDEPSLDELSMEEFLARFPEGVYEFEGRTLEGELLVGEADFTHTMPAAPQNLSPADGALVDSSLPVVASFDAVTQDLDGEPLEPELYEIVIENEEEEVLAISVVLRGDTAAPSITIPPEFLEPGTEYKLEVIVQEESGNRTISETVFSTQ